MPRSARPRVGQGLLAAQAIAAVAQAAALSQAAMLLFAGPSRETDAYFLVYFAVQVALALIALGVLQPLTLATPRDRSWFTWWLATTATAIAAAAACVAYLAAVGYPLAATATTALLLALAALPLSAAHVLGIRLAALGDARYLAGATLLPNLLGSLAYGTSGFSVAWMCVGILGGATLTASLYVQRSRRVRIVEAHAERDAGADILAVRRLLVAGTVGTVGPFALTLVTASYPAGQATVLGVISRIGAGVVTIGVTTFLNVVVTWARRDPRPIHRLSVAAGTSHVTFLLGAVAVVYGQGEADTRLAATLAGGAWVSSATCQAALSRWLTMKDDFRPFLRGALVTVPTYGLACAALIMADPSATLYLTLLSGVALMVNVVFLGTLWPGRFTYGYIASTAPLTSLLIAGSW